MDLLLTHKNKCLIRWGCHGMAATPAFTQAPTLKMLPSVLRENLVCHGEVRPLSFTLSMLLCVRGALVHSWLATIAPILPVLQ